MMCERALSRETQGGLLGEKHLPSQHLPFARREAAPAKFAELLECEVVDL